LTRAQSTPGEYARGCSLNTGRMLIAAAKALTSTTMMTGAQASYLKTLSEEAHHPEPSTRG